MSEAVNRTASIDDDQSNSSSFSTPFKRRRSSIFANDHPSASKRLRSTSNSSSNLQTMINCLNNIVQSHRNLVEEYLDLHRSDRTAELSPDEQRFIQSEEELIRTVERNLHELQSSWLNKSTELPKKTSLDRVKHESDILKRIEQLKSEGKWSTQRLSKVVEPKIRKTHWDYLLDEMKWLAEDFAHEKRWKQMMAKKLSLAILRYFREKNQAETQQQREEMKRLRKHALFVCKEVMNFWKNMHKIAEYKETTRIQELKKHQLDLHLNFIVDQTEQYSDWLVQSLKNAKEEEEEDSDNEETIEEEEKEEPDEYSKNEIEALAADQEESIDNLLKRHYGIELSNSSSEKENNHPDVTKRNEMNDLARTAQALQPTGFTLNTTEVKTPVPFLLKHSLREYQHVGLDWLVTLYEKKLNCILADEMGLGKTIQTIALLAHLACEKGVWGPHLIVVPTSVMLNWELEFKKWCPAFKILTYYGSVKERQLKRQGWTKVNAFHVCITSYKLVLQDAKAFRRKKWKYLILDEAQNIKNFKSQRWQTLLNFHSQRRLLLTGTPLQNSLMELWSLMHFLMPNLFASHEEFRQWFSNPLTEMIEQGQMNSNDLLIKRLHKVLRPFILRRLKIDVEKQMPKKHEHLIMCHLSKRQRQLYDDFIQCRSTRDAIQSGNYMSVINILMQLRKVCNHPDLFEARPTLSPLTIPKKFIVYQIPRLIDQIELKNPSFLFNVTPNDTFLSFRIRFTLQASREMIFETIDQSETNDRLVLPLTLEQIERYRHSSLWFSSSLRSPRSMKKLSPLANNFLDDLYQPDPIYFHLNEKRQEQRRQRFELLTRLNTDRCQSRPIYGSDVLQQIQLAIQPCSRAKRTPFNGYAACLTAHSTHSTSKEFFSRTETLKHLVRTDRSMFDEFQEILDRFLFCITRVLASPIDLCQLNGITRRERPSIELLSSANQSRQKMFLQFPERRLIEYDCGKLQTLALLLARLKREKHRCLIFTQMTKMLDVFEVFLNYHGYTYVRLDGTTPILQRQILMERFNSDEKIFVFILSTRAGGIGVNLTGADTVIFYDSDWNPTMDAQAQDRCHRIGQTKDVHIYRLICRNTVEENILKKANQKRLLGDLTIDGGSFDVSYFKKNHIRELFDDNTSLEEMVRQRNEYQQQIESARNNPTTTTENNNDLTLTQYEEALAAAEDETDRQAAKELDEEVKAELNEFNEEETNEEMNEDQLIEKQKKQMKKIEDELKTLDEQLRPIERYALRCVEAYRQEYQLTQVPPNTFLDPEQVRKDWQLNRLKALKEEEEKQYEQEEDEMMYTYALDNERQSKYSYTYSAAQNSLVANELARHEKSTAAIAAQQSTSAPPPPVVVVAPPIVPPKPPVPPSPPAVPTSIPPPRPVLIKRPSSTIEEHPRRRPIQIVPPPPPPSAPRPTPALIQKPPVKQATVYRAIKTRNNSHDDCGDSATLSVADDFDDDDDDEGPGSHHQIYSSKSKTTLSTVTRKPIVTTVRTISASPSSTLLNPPNTTTTTTTTNTSTTVPAHPNGQPQQQIWIINSLGQQSVISLLNYIHPNASTNK